MFGQVPQRSPKEPLEIDSARLFIGQMAFHPTNHVRTLQEWLK